MTADTVHENNWPVRLSSIKVGPRHRRDLGDIAALAKSIDTIGLINPITVDSDFNLIAGGRRLEALRTLGWDHAEVRIVEGLDGALARLTAERDENTCRKDFAPSELVAVAESLAALEAPKAKERQGKRTDLEPCAHMGTKSEAGRTREKVAQALGVGRSTIGRARLVVDAAEDADPEVRAVARKAREDMDSGAISIAKAADLVRRARSPQPKRPVGRGHSGSAAIQAERIREMASEGFDSGQIAAKLGVRAEYVRLLARDADINLPDTITGRRRRIDPNRVVSESVSALEGIALGLGLLSDEDLDGLDIQQVDGWAISLSDSLRSVNRLAKQLKEMTRD